MTKQTFKQFLENIDESISEFPDWLIKEYKNTANFLRHRGAKVQIDHAAPSIKILLGNGKKFFLDGRRAEKLLNDVPPDISPEDFALASSSKW